MHSDIISRRALLAVAGTGLVAGTAGCLSQADPSDDATPTATATPVGTTAEPTGRGNVLYAFAPGSISVIDPESGDVLGDIDPGGEGIDWADALTTADNRYLFVNDTSRAQVLVVDTRERAVVKRLEVGPRPVHMYHVGDRELWTHSDEEGAFYVIDAEELAVTGRVVAALDDTGHGKLATHANLGSKAYATNTNDPGVHVIDLDAKESTGFVEFEGGTGTHAKCYNPVSNRAYVELIGGESPRTAAVDVETDAVEQYYDVGGQVFNTPDDRYVVWADKRNDQVHVLDAESGEFTDPIVVEGGPDKIFFLVHGGTTYGFTANTQSPDTAVIDFSTMEVVARVDAGDIARPEGAHHLHRTGLTAAGYFVTPASGDGVVSIIDAATLERTAAVAVGEGVDGVAYVGDIA